MKVYAALISSLSIFGFLFLLLLLVEFYRLDARFEKLRNFSFYSFMVVGVLFVVSKVFDVF